MKVIIVSNCNGQAYYNYLKHFFPNWDVRLAIHKQAVEWTQDRKPEFLDFLKVADLFIGMPTSREVVAEAGLNPQAHTMVLPGLLFKGLHPDCIMMKGLLSPLRNGFYHSKICLAAYVLGLSPDEIVGRYNDRRYKDLGYYTVYKSHRLDVEKQFRWYKPKAAHHFSRWRGEGDFFFTPNHPRGFVMFDVFHSAMCSAGLQPDVSDDAIEDARKNLPDYLAEGKIWPVYPELATHLGLTVENRLWREATVRNKGRWFGVEEMVERSVSTYDATPGVREQIVAALGSMDEVERHAG